jgi:hypothetical protein
MRFTSELDIANANKQKKKNSSTLIYIHSNFNTHKGFDLKFETLVSYLCCMMTMVEPELVTTASSKFCWFTFMGF